MLSRLTAAALLALTLVSCQPLPRRTIPLPLGTGEITLALHSRGRALPVFLVLHANERTATEAGIEAIRTEGGRLFVMEAQGRRLVTFELDGQMWRFDPNRIFTETGAMATLQEHSGSAPPEVLAEVRRFADTVLAASGIASRPPGSLHPIITLHNNSEGEYSAASYLPEGELAHEAAAVHLPPDADPDDFFFVTDRTLYESLAAEGFAVVLQDNTRVTDDGSLSVWAGRQGLPYVNIEAEHGHFEQQVRMLEALARVLRPIRRFPTATARSAGCGEPAVGASSIRPPYDRTSSSTERPEASPSGGASQPKSTDSKS